MCGLGKKRATLCGKVLERREPGGSSNRSCGRASRVSLEHQHPARAAALPVLLELAEMFAGGIALERACSRICPPQAPRLLAADASLLLLWPRRSQ